jgi:thiol-disulfide isomerase/thioredoxin/outer membrane lipoprotein-sorting protein
MANLRIWAVGVMVGLLAPMSFAADPATTQSGAADAKATTAPAAATTEAATNVPLAKIAPDAAPILAQVKQAYAKLEGLALAGKVTGDFDVDGQQDNPSIEFTASFAAPNQFKHENKDDAVVGSTGEKLYVLLKQRNVYLTADAPKKRVMSDEMPEPFGNMIPEQDLSLALALSSDAQAELARSYAKIAKGADTTIDGKAYTTLEMTREEGKPAVNRLMIDPQTHLIRRATMDLSGDLAERGAREVKRAVVTMDYTTVTPGAKPEKPDAFAWVPPPSARDAADQAAGDNGPAGELAGKPAPDFTLKGLDGKDVKLADLKGSVVVLDFWATWCGPCVMSLPGLDQLHQAKKEAGVKVFAVNQQEEKDLVQGFMSSKNLTVPVLLDSDGQVGRD